MTRFILNTAAIISVILTQSVESQLSPIKHRMEFPEEQDPGTIVANLPQMFNVRFNDLPGRYFEIIGQRMKVGNKVVMSNGKWLKIDRFSGVIAVDEPVDRETECGEDPDLECVIMLQTAMLPQNHFRLQNFELVVTDINDHSPKFPTSVKNRIIHLNISEDTRVLSTINIDRFMATDEDIGDNAAIHYSMSRNDHFSVNEYEDDTGAHHLELILQSPLDYEVTPRFNVDLTATDQGSPIKRSTQVSLHITVLDVNDNAPVFDESVYDLQLQENIPSGHVIATVHATDLDKGVFGQVRYFVPHSGNAAASRRFVNVDPRSGEVRLRSSPDRETKKMVKVIIAAQDSPGLPYKKIGRTILMIHITDVNDNSPRIDVNIIIKGPDDAAYVSEEAELGTYIAHVSATDTDHGKAGEVTLSIASIRKLPSGADSNSQGARSGVARDNYFVMRDNLIATNRRLDRETEDKYMIQIKACDAGTPRRCSFKSMKVIILDSNDHAPKFLSTDHVVTIPENMQVGSVIDTVVATDLDSTGTPALSLSESGEFGQSRNGKVRYSLQGGGSVFAIDSITGSIKLVGVLDYETRSLWKIVATAQDLGNPPKKSNLTVTITVTDINDHRPIFVKPEKKNTTVYATILEDRTIIRIKTVDRDAGDNADVWYSIVREDGSDRGLKFLIDPVSGSLRLNVSNKLTELLGEHTLEIKASDKGAPPMESSMPIIIKVIDLPLSSVIPDYDDNDEEQNTKITAIILSSLAAATLILLVILVCIVIKCRKEKKEFRVYNFRAAEIGSRSGLSCASTTNIRGGDEVGSVSTLRATLSRREMMHGRDNGRKEFCTYPGKANLDLQQNEGLKFTTFSRLEKDSDNTSVNKFPTVPAGDGDSGRGDSDRETDSNVGDGDKRQITQSSTSQMQCRYLANMGPRCTPSCRKYGHSDECWMPIVAGSDIEQNERVSIADHYQANSSIYNSTDHLMSRSSILDSMSIADPCGLETISETQPLRVVLDLGNSLVPSGNARQENSEYPSFPRRTNNYIYSDSHGNYSYQCPNSGWYPRRDVHYGEVSSRSHFPSTEIHVRRGSYCGSVRDSADSRRLLTIDNDTDNQSTKMTVQAPSRSRPHSACPQIDYQPVGEAYSAEHARHIRNAVITGGSIDRAPFRNDSLRTRYSRARDSDTDSFSSHRRNTHPYLSNTNEYGEQHSLTDTSLKRTRRIISDVDGYTVLHPDIA